VRVRDDPDDNLDFDEDIPKQGPSAQVPRRGRMSPVIANQNGASRRFPFRRER
jgi:hypothetical protein